MFNSQGVDDIFISIKRSVYEILVDSLLELVEESATLVYGYLSVYSIEYTKWADDDYHIYPSTRIYYNSLIIINIIIIMINLEKKKKTYTVGSR